MSAKTSITLRIVSRSDGKESTTVVKAEQYDKNGSYYLRYAEPEAELGRTMTTVRLEREQIRIIRHGDTESELVFEPLRRRRGFYRTPHGMLDMETETERLEVRWEASRGEAEWTYHLYAGGEPAGRFELRLTAEPLA